MQRTFFITGTDTGAGKTVLATLLTRFLRERGIKVATFKPVCSGGRDDARKIHTALDETLTLDEINPWHFRAAIAPALAAKIEKTSITLAQVLAHIRSKRSNLELTLVEGAGGLLSPLGKDFDSRDLILALRATPIIVAPNQLGVVNHLLLTLEALPKNYRAKSKVVLMSPAKPDSATTTNAGLLGDFFPSNQIFTLPWLGTTPKAKAAALKKSEVRRMLAALAT